MTQKKEREVEFILAWRHYTVGRRIAPGGMLGGWLVQYGFAKWVDELPEPKPEPALAETVILEPKTQQKPKHKGKQHASHHHIGTGSGTVVDG